MREPNESPHLTEDLSELHTDELIELRAKIDVALAQRFASDKTDEELNGEVINYLQRLNTTANSPRPMSEHDLLDAFDNASGLYLALRELHRRASSSDR